MAGNYKIKIEPILNTASLNKQLNETKKLNLSGSGQSAGTSWVTGFGKAITERFKYSIANALIYGTENAIKDMVANVRELDAAQVELKKVTDLSGKSLDKFTEQAYKMSGSVAKTGTEIIQASTEFAKQGFDTDTALQLANVASQFQNIADTEIDAATAAKFINSQLKAFGNTNEFKGLINDAEKATKVIDSVNEVANNFGVGTNDLQMALTKTSAAMKGYGNSYSETIGLITAGTEVMPNQASKVARGWRSIGANILKLAQETDTLETANGKVKVALKDSNGELRSTFAILEDLYPQWKTLNNEERSSLALMLSGKTQTEVFQSTMDNFTHAIEANQTAQESQGSAAKENAKYLDSIEGKLQTFQSAWEQLSYHVINSDFIKNVIDLGTTVIEILDNIVQKVGAMPALFGMLGTAIAGMKIAKQTSKWLGLASAAGEVAEGVAEIGGAAEVASGVGGVGALTKALGLLTNPAVLVGIAAVGAAIAAIAWDKYFSFESSLQRLNNYQDKLEEVTAEIEELRTKRNSDDGLTKAEETHLAVLEAEERSLERQIELEKQRVQDAFKKDVSTRQGGKRYKNKTGPTELLDYQAAREKEIEKAKQLAEIEEAAADARKKARYWRNEGDESAAKSWEAQADALDKRIQKLGDSYLELSADTAEAASSLAQYWEEVSNNVDYESLTDSEKESFDNIHKAFLESQIDAYNLKDSYEDVAEVLNSAMDSLGHENLDLFDNIDISSIQTVDDAINAVKEQLQGLDGDTEITFKVKDEDGNVEERIKKVSELTDEDIEAIVHFNATGIEEVDVEADEVAQNRDSVVNLTQQGAQEVSKIADDAAKNRDSTINVSQEGASTAGSDIDSAAKDRTTVINVIAKGITAVKQALSGIGHAKGKRKGEAGGLAWLGDEGSASNPKPELVVGEKGAYLAGTSGWELHSIKASDTVYSYSDTKKLLGGSQSFAGAVSSLPRYKKGKISAATKKKKREKFDKALEKLKHKQKVNHWTDAKFQSEYQKLYKKYAKYLSKDQKWDYTESREDYQNDVAKDKFEKLADNIITKDDFNSFKKKVNANKNLSADEKAELIQDAGNKYYASDFDRRLGILGVRGADGKSGAGARLDKYLADIKSNEYLSAAEKEEYARKGYEAVAQYNLQEYKNGVKTREETLQSIKDYYNEVGAYDETYYQMLDELRESDKEKELERLKDLEQAHTDSLSLAEKYVQRQRDAIQKQIDAEEDEAEKLEKLKELEKDLTTAKAKKIRVYREGVGFVYEQDVEAVEKAQKALTDYNKSLEKSDLEKQVDALQAVLDLFDDLRNDSDIRELEISLGVSGLTQLLGGDFGTDVSLWGDWIRKQYASATGYADVYEQLNNVATSQINDWLNSGTGYQVASSIINEAVAQHSYASGTLSAPGGLSLVGDKFGGELVWLGKGDSVFTNAISRNLMEWGRYNPAQVAGAMSKSNSSQIFNFDKIVLPNVRDAEDFYRELQNLPNKALQQSTLRI